MQKIARTMLILSIFHPATAQPQSQKSQIWRVPVVPQGESSSGQSDQPFELAPQPGKVEKLQRLLSPWDGSASTAHEYSASQQDFEKAKSVKDFFAQSGMTPLGAESGGWSLGRVTLRGFPSREPEVSVDGVPLTSGFTGAGSEDLVPVPAIQEIQVFPFLSVAGLPRRGLSGGYNLRLKSGRQPAAAETVFSSEHPFAAIVAHRLHFNCQIVSEVFPGCLNAAWQASHRRGPQKVRNDNNTPNEMSDDFDDALRFNSVDRASVALKSNIHRPSGLALESLVVAGFEDRGINGLPLVSQSPNNRMRRSLSLLSHSGSSLSPTTGQQWDYRLSGRIETAVFSNELNNRSRLVRKDERKENAFAGAFATSHPLVVAQFDARAFFNSSLESNEFQSTVSALSSALAEAEPGNEAQPWSGTRVQGQLRGLDFGGGLELLKSSRFLLRLETFARWIRVSQEQSCGVGSPQVLCSSQFATQSSLAPGVGVEAQYGVARQTVLYLVSGRNMRLPTPLELAGSPDGILAHPSLAAESSVFLESGLRTPWVDLGSWYASDRNLITLRQVSPFLVKYENTPRSHRFGAFMKAFASWRRWDLQASHEQTWAQSEQRWANHSQLPFVPASQSQWGIVRHVQIREPSALWAPWNVGLSLHRTGPYFLDREGLYRLTPPLRMAFTLEGRSSQVDPRLSLTARVENLLDLRTSTLAVSGSEARQVAWSYLPALPIAGRSFVLSLRLLTP